MADGESIQQSVATILCWLAFAFNLTLAFYIAASPADFMLVFILSANLLRKLSDAMEQLITCLGKWEEVEDLWETGTIRSVDMQKKKWKGPENSAIERRENARACMYGSAGNRRSDQALCSFAR